MEKQFNKPAVLKATERVDKLISFLLANSEADEEWKEIEWLILITLYQVKAVC